VTSAQSVFRFALACWLVLLISGVGTFSLWWLTRAESLVLVGLLAILFGAGLAAVGGYQLMSLPRLAGEESRPRAWTVRRFLLGVLLLGSNFPVALGLTFAVGSLHSRFEVVVQNDSGVSLSSLRLVSGASAPPKASWSRAT